MKIKIYNEDRYEDINVLGTCYLILRNATFDARQAHNTSVCLIFPALHVNAGQQEQTTPSSNWLGEEGVENYGQFYNQN